MSSNAAPCALPELLSPIGRRPEFLARAVRAELVVGGALLGVLERLVRLGHFLELLLGVLLLGHVGMVLAGEPAVRGLDVVRAASRVDPEDPVVVLVFHRCTSGTRRRSHYCKPAQRVRLSSLFRVELAGATMAQRKTIAVVRRDRRARRRPGARDPRRPRGWFRGARDHARREFRQGAGARRARRGGGGRATSTTSRASRARVRRRVRRVLRHVLLGALLAREGARRSAQHGERREGRGRVARRSGRRWRTRARSCRADADADAHGQVQGAALRREGRGGPVLHAMPDVPHHVPVRVVSTGTTSSTSARARRRARTAPCYFTLPIGDEKMAGIAAEDIGARRLRHLQGRAKYCRARRWARRAST